MLKKSISCALIVALGVAFAFSFGARKSAIAAANPAAVVGAKVYSENCSSCHGATGGGTAGVFPPLAGNPMVVGSPDKVIAAVKSGLTGATTVNGKSYNGSMPAWKSKLSNAEIADVITYIRSSWGNTAGAVTEAKVAGSK
jgi:cbb3-type cytochrome c oxidase subunit III